MDIVEKATANYPTTEVKRQIDYNVDLGHLTVFDINNTASIQKEDQLKSNIRDGVQVLINNLWNQPTRASEDHTLILAALPTPVFQLPREKPVPQVSKVLTRWEKFAREKGIRKTKRSRLVYDEEKKDWVPRHGYKAANQNESEWLIEVKQGQDPYEDLFEKKREDKKQRVEKNKKQQIRNQDAELAASKGVSMADIRSQKRVEIESALKVTGKSTASMGKFDKSLDLKGAIKVKSDKRKFEPVATDIGKENEMSKKIASKLLK